MSDSVTQIEIEDVLSSIRRLVSEDARPRPAKKAGGLQDRLVLTPSQRVEAGAVERSEDASLRQNSEAVAPAAPDEDMPKPQDVAVTVREEVARVVRSEPARPAVDAVESAVSPLDAVARLVEKAVEKEVETALADRDASGGSSRPQDGQAREQRADDNGLEPEVSILERKIAALEALVAQGADEFEPEYNGPESRDMPTAPVWEPEDLDPEPVTGDALTDLLNRTLLEDADPEDDLEVPLIEAEEEETSKVVDLPLSVPGKSTATIAQGDGAAPPVSDLPEDKDDAVGARDVSEKLDETRDSEPAQFVRSPHLTVVADDTEMLDAEMLRSMVVQIVREELQSTLGERITRNVRKLVRREIQRAMMNHSLD